MEAEQLNLFPDSQLQQPRSIALLMGRDALVNWKSQIATHQQHARESKPAVQGTLFDMAPAHTDPDAIDPFSLPLSPMSFYELPADKPGGACLYFVIDSAVPIILYIGETCRSNLRWKGRHNAKGYLDHYQSLHHRHGVKAAVNIAFWWDARSAGEGAADVGVESDSEMAMRLRRRCANAI